MIVNCDCSLYYSFNISYDRFSRKASAVDGRHYDYAAAKHINRVSTILDDAFSILCEHDLGNRELHGHQRR